MNFKTPDGKIYKGVWEFYEYPKTLKHIENVDRLRRLHDTRIEQNQARELSAELCFKKGLPLPNFQFNGWTDNAIHWDFKDGLLNVIQIRSSYISTEHLIHELAHHWVTVKLGRQDYNLHGFDFAIRLDQLAEMAEQILY